jgi:hypothetical protein
MTLPDASFSMINNLSGSGNASTGGFGMALLR